MKKLDEAAKGGMIIQFLHRGLIYAWAEEADLALADFAEVMNRVKPRRDWFATPQIMSADGSSCSSAGARPTSRKATSTALADSNGAGSPRGPPRPACSATGSMPAEATTTSPPPTATRPGDSSPTRC